MTRNAASLVVFLLFVGVPILEITLFIQVGGAIGLWPTLAIVLATAVLGTVLVRAQGVATFNELRRRMEAGENPAAPLAHAALILAAGLLLLTPGFFTDAVGFALMLPPVRAAIIGGLRERIASKIVVHGASRPAARDAPIEAEYEAIDPDTDDGPQGPRGTSGWTKPR